MLNPFTQDAFNLVSMVAAINRLPNQYGRLRTSGLFATKGVAQRTIMVERKDGVLNLLSPLPVGSPGWKNTHGTRDIRSFVVPHYPLDDVLLPQDYDGIRQFGTENQVASAATIMNDRLQTMKNKHDITLEWLMIGALKGVLYHADASTEIYDLYKEFLITRKEVDFVLGTATTDIKKKCLEVKRHIEINLKGEVMTGIRVLVDKDFFDALTNHPKVITAYERWQAGAALRNDMRTSFPFAGLIFEEYEATSTDLDGNARKFLASKDGVAYPEGTQNTFKLFFAPADFLETVNTLGLPYYAKQKERDFGRGVDIHTQTNPLPLVCRPEVCVRVYTSST